MSLKKRLKEVAGDEGDSPSSQLVKCPECGEEVAVEELCTECGAVLLLVVDDDEDLLKSEDEEEEGEEVNHNDVIYDDDEDLDCLKDFEDLGIKE